jgi:hypothetical protein
MHLPEALAEALTSSRKDRNTELKTRTHSEKGGKTSGYDEDDFKMPPGRN